MSLPPQQRRRAPQAPAGNPGLANGDQTVTKVDARLTKVDKTDHRQPPASTPNPRKTQQNCKSRPHANPIVNPRCQPLRHIPNKPEQIRTDPNKPEHRQTPRPDKDTPRIAPGHPQKTNPEHRRRPRAVSHLPPHLRARRRYPAEPSARPLPQFTPPPPIPLPFPQFIPPPFQGGG